MKPRLTDRVLRGLIASTSAMLAGPIDEAGGFSTKEAKEIEDADQWLRRMREWRKEQKQRK